MLVYLCKAANKITKINKVVLQLVHVHGQKEISQKDAYLSGQESCPLKYKGKPVIRQDHRENHD